MSRNSHPCVCGHPTSEHLDMGGGAAYCRSCYTLGKPSCSRFRPAPRRPNEEASTQQTVAERATDCLDRARTALRRWQEARES